MKYIKYFKDWWEKLGKIAEKQSFDFTYKHLRREVEELGEPGANIKEELGDCLNTIGIIYRIMGYEIDFISMLEKLHAKDEKFGTKD